MSPLEIISVSVLGFIALLAALYLILLSYLKNNREENFETFSTQVKSGKIVFLGDSLTDFFPFDELFLGLEIYNRGIAGDTTKNVLKRLDTIYKMQPSSVFLQIGTNDIAVGAKTVAVAGRIEQIIDALEQNIPAVRILVISQYPINKRHNFFAPVFCALRTNKKLIELSRLEREMCERRNITYIDAFDVLTDGRGNLKKEFSQEGLHVSAAGYLELSRLLKPYVVAGSEAEAAAANEDEAVEQIL